MSYRIDSQYRIDRGSRAAVIKRYDLRNRSVEILVPTWKPVEMGILYSDEDYLWFERDDFSMFMKAFVEHAWDIGIKPTAFKEDNAQLEAIKYHLEDMRAMAFGKDPIK